jgi:thiamine phosphate synthase YjbQ (UPF0047 family)
MNKMKNLTTLDVPMHKMRFRFSVLISMLIPVLTSVTAIAITLGLLIFLAPHAHAASTVIEVTGDVKTNNDVLQAFSEIRTGQKFKLASGAKVTVLDSKKKLLTKLVGPGEFSLLADGKLVDLKPSTSVKSSVQTEALPAKFQGLQLNTQDVAQASLQLRGAAQAKLNLLTPAGNYIPNEGVTLSWEAVSAADDYLVEVADATGTPILTIPLTTTRLELKDTQLKAGTRYRYSVTARLKDSKTAFGWGEFSVVSAELARDLSKAKPTKDAPLTEHRLYLLALTANNLKQAADEYRKEHP